MTQPSTLASPPLTKLARTVLVSVLICCILGLGLSVITLWQQRSALSLAGLWRGQLTTTIDTLLDDHTALRPFAITTWALTDYLLFRQGRTGVLVGEQGWLFSDEEFVSPQALEAASIEQGVGFVCALAAVTDVAETLAAADIQLLLALLPAKARVYSNQLGRYDMPAAVTQRYEQWRRGLLEHNLHSPDLMTPLTTTSASFLRTDTHWTPEGAEAVAVALHSYATNEGLWQARNPSYVTTQQGSREHEGDLLAFLPLGVARSLGPAADTLALYQTQSGEASSLGLFDDLTVDITLVGSSYSANPAWHFEGWLEQTFHTDVVNVATEGQGPLQPMLDYLSSNTFTDNPPKLVIWEIPERYLPVQDPSSQKSVNLPSCLLSSGN
ncbi:MAG: alginate O-acetyltransferase [Deinococcota bacterium]